MFDMPLEAWYVWLGLGMVSVAVAGTALALPTAAPPSPAPAADTIDRVAASPSLASATVELAADRVKLSPHTVALETDGARAHAQLAFGPVTPVSSGSLRSVLDGRTPASVFRSKQRFERAIATARDTRSRWVPAPDTLTVRRVRWGDVNATLAG